MSGGGFVEGKRRKLVRPERFELPTYCSGGNRSIHLSYGRTVFSLHARTDKHQREDSSSPQGNLGAVLLALPRSRVSGAIRVAFFNIA